MPSLDLAVISVLERANEIPGDLLVKSREFRAGDRRRYLPHPTSVDILGHALLRMSELVRGGHRGESCVKHQGRYCFRRTCDLMPPKPTGAKARLNCFCVLMGSHGVPVDVGKTGDVLFCDRRCISISMHQFGTRTGLLSFSDSETLLAG